MKEKTLTIFVLAAMIILLLAFKKGWFNTSIVNDSYVSLKIPDKIDYNFHVKPILSDNCYTCHGPDANKRKAGLRLDIDTGVFIELKESAGKFAIVPKKPTKSEIYLRIISEDEKLIMPPSNSNLALTSYEKEIIKKWIDQGAEYQKHWSFIPPIKKELPKVKNKDWAQNEIDYFVLANIEDNNLSPSKKAENHKLIRRISLDLTGLPPKNEQVEKLITNNSEENISNIIDEFLASSSYGERMTQEWLDVARYADSHGYQDDNYRTMWPWRDWVIHAFNKNLPYDQFITWQIAGDLLPNPTKEQVLATGFNRNHPITQEGGVVQEEYLSTYVTDRTNTLGKGLLGMTIECAKCHDHKYDPISQKEYFEMYAFFNNVKEKGLRYTAPKASKLKYFADEPFIEIKKNMNAQENVLSFINMNETESVNVMVMNDSEARVTHILNRGSYDDLGDVVNPGTPKSILAYSENLPKNRLGLALWLTDKNNPLTARVYVNRIWAMLFGQGLVKTPDDFGVQGSLPTHPELLDWLSKDFMDHNWDIKYLIKKIMLSATYQQSSETTAELKKTDPENLLLARAPRFRLSGEMIRDYILTTSGLLNAEIGGPSVRPYQPDSLWEEMSTGRGSLNKYERDKGDKLYRRSLYTFWKRTMPPPSMTVFDAPTRDICEVKRQKTNTPLQALALQNDEQVLEATRVIAQKTLQKKTTSIDLISDIFQKILIRKPTNDELHLLTNYYSENLKSFSSEKDSAYKLLTVGDYEKSTSDPTKTAALMLTAQVIYNLDEAITKE